MLTLTTLASGSSGNCLLVDDGTTRVLVDAGISCRRIRQSLGVLGLALSDLDAICVTTAMGWSLRSCPGCSLPMSIPTIFPA